MANQISIYRALTGSKIDRGGSQWRGVSDPELAGSGIFFSNQSSQQTRQVGISPLLAPDFIQAEGLPVYLNKQEAINWIGTRIFQGGRPAIAVATVPLKALLGEDSLMVLARTGGSYYFTETDLRRHLSQREIITGECELSGDLDSLRKKTMFLRPVAMDNGRVVQERGWQKISLTGEGGRKRWL